MTIPETSINEWDELEPRYQELVSRSFNDQAAYEFLLDWSDLVKEIEETSTFLNLRSDLNTADEYARAQLSHFNQVTNPKVTVANASLRKRFLSLLRPELKADALLIRRRMQTDEGAYCEANVTLEADHADLINEFSRLTGNNLAEYKGEKLTIPQIQKKLRDPDRSVREGVWRAWQQAKLSIAPALDELFLKMLGLRKRMAANLGTSNFRDLIWLKYHRYDYSPRDCLDLGASIAEEVVPLATELLEQHRQKLGISSLKPWDFYWRAPVDPESREPLHPFDTVDELEATTESIFSAPANLSIEQIDHKAAELIARFMPQTDWRGFETELAKVWHYHHIFSAPFYYIEYGLSWLGALQIWQRSLKDPVGALTKYRAALTLGNSVSVPDLFAAAGAEFAFDRLTVRRLLQFLRDQLATV
jgi:oligoendopeptidase F